MATAVILALAVTAAARWIVLRRIVLRRVVGRRRGVRIRLLLLGKLAISLVVARGLSRFMMFFVRFEMLAGRSIHLVLRSVLLVNRILGVVAGRFFVMFEATFGRMLVSSRQALSRQQLDCGICRLRLRRGCGWQRLTGMPVIVVFEVFEDIAHVQERVAIQADVHKGGLHARKDSRDFSFVDAADQREFFFALDVDFD